MSEPATTIVIFGASGDLTDRKLIPALLNLYCKDRLPRRFNIVGTSRRPYTHDEFRTHLMEGIRQYAPDKYNGGECNIFMQHIWYQPHNAMDEQGYRELDTFLRDLEDGPAHRLYYLAVAPSLYIPIVENLGKTGMAHENETEQRNIVVEKPFGSDLASAQALNHAIHGVFQEHQVYRIDHYLGKETAQNILFFRFANTIFEPVWNRNYVDQVQITVMEEVDVEHRGEYYDQAGVLRDMFQNHLLQLLCLVAMEPPASFNADALRNEKVKVLSAIRPIMPDDTVCAQYDGYRETRGVAPDSHTPTYAALKLHIDNWRWQGVPFYLRSGKALGAKVSEVLVQFKCPPLMMFNASSDTDCFMPNLLALCIQPDEGIHLKFEAKVPGSIKETRSVDMEFHYRSSFGDGALPDAYERLLLDALSGDPSLFTRSDEIEMAWQLMDPVITCWDTTEFPPLATYPRGSWGPAEADAFLAREDRIWWRGCMEH